ncbi:hypothetical protein COD90_07245 [Bacillus cereus]|uniref:hypothetical protein n=1 Tax=Bacillus sp. OE TaxID=2293320 RepID=UPI000BFC40A2|nr:hypothetical protein COD90_07245 [Bacillus cereus]RFB12434.1 hypothetical protein DZB88_17075 [Bacillus sp. OE]
MLSTISDVLGIISTIVTIIIWFSAKTLKKKIEELNAFFHFTSNKDTIRKELLTVKNHIIKSGIAHAPVRNLAITTRKIEPYTKYMNNDDKESLNKVKEIIDRGFVVADESDLITNILKLIGFLDTNHELNLENI